MNIDISSSSTSVEGIGTISKIETMLKTCLAWETNNL